MNFSIWNSIDVVDIHMEKMNFQSHFQSVTINVYSDALH